MTDPPDNPLSRGQGPSPLRLVQERKTTGRRRQTESLTRRLKRSLSRRSPQTDARTSWGAGLSASGEHKPHRSEHPKCLKLGDSWASSDNSSHGK